MDGNIRMRKQLDGSKRYQARYSRAHPSKPGQRLVNVKTFGLKKDAQNWLAEQHVRYNRDPHARPDRAKMPFSKLVEQWWSVKASKLQPKSADRYEQVLRAHLTPEFGQAPVASINREWIRDFLAGLASQTKTTTDAAGHTTVEPKYAPGTLHKIHTTLSSIMQEAVVRGIVTANPCRGVAADVVRPQTRQMDCLTPAEVALLADAITPHYKDLIYVAAYTGLRAGELHALRVKDVDLTQGRIRVSRALKVWRQGTPEFGSTKTDKPRTVELAPEILELLTAHIHSIPHPTPDSLVFTNAAGGPIHQVAWLRNHFKPATSKALPDHPTLRFHDLRHTFVTMLIQQGVNVKAIANQAGHASAAMTLDRYSHYFPADDAKVKNALSAAFTSATHPPASNVFALHPKQPAA